MNPNDYTHTPPSRADTLNDQLAPKRNGDGLRSILSAVGLMAAALSIAFSVAAFVIQSYQVDGESMESTLSPATKTSSESNVISTLPGLFVRSIS